MKMKIMIKRIDHINRPRLYVDTNELNIKSIWVRWILYALCNNLCPSNGHDPNSYLPALIN